MDLRGRQSQPRDDELRIGIDSPVPNRVAPGAGSALFVSGHCFHPRASLKSLELRLASVRETTMAHGLPRPDVASRHPDRHAYRSGFWGIVPVPAAERSATVELGLEATLEDGSNVGAAVAAIELASAGPDRPTPTGDRIAICMATFEPRLDLFVDQIDSIRAQTNRDWVCLISDDHSATQTLREIERVVAGDPRFVVSAAERRLGAYANFERALGMVPDDARYVALSDQDDRWHPEKLDVLRASIGEAMLVYSDARIVSESGAVHSDTYWTRRRNNHSSFASLMLANTVTGAASLCRRELIDRALPFPHAFARFFHDHWLAMVAIACGEIAYVDRPLYDYVQHGRASLGHERAHAWAKPPRPRRVRARHLLRDPQYFYEHWRRTYFLEYCRIALLAQALLARFGAGLEPRKRRTAERLLRAERSPTAIAWLAARGLRRFVGLDETLRAEGRMLRAFVWRRLIARGDGHPEGRSRWLPHAAGLPQPDRSL
ncbi:MAG: glycosyltransferase [Solirubrobacterales bacterium]